MEYPIVVFRKWENNILSYVQQGYQVETINNTFKNSKKCMYKLLWHNAGKKKHITSIGFWNRYFSGYTRISLRTQLARVILIDKYGYSLSRFANKGRRGWFVGSLRRMEAGNRKTSVNWEF